MTEYLGYVRVSTVKQGDGVSLDAQKEAILAYATTNAFTIIEWFEEKETAAKQGRPVFNAMVKALKQRNAAGFIVHKIDRSARNFKDWARIGDLADEGFDIHFATETLDFRSRGGRLSADIQAVIAADYIRNLREETKKGIDGRLKQGFYPFKAPIGYLDNGGGKLKTHDPARAELVKDMFRLYASGQHSLRTLRVEMTTRGLTNCRGKPPSKALIESALSNPFYCGIIRIRTTGQTYQGKHQPLISVNVYERVQDVKSGKCGKKVTKHNHTYRGLFKCAHCGYSMIAERQKGRVYYRCHTSGCPSMTLREDVIEKGVASLLKSLRLTDDAQGRLVTTVSGWVDERLKKDVGIQKYALEQKDIEDRIESLTDALVDRLIDKETYTTRHERLLLEKTQLKQKMCHARDLASAPENVRKFLELVKNLAGYYKNLNRLEKRLFVEITTSNRLLRGKSLELKPSKWLRSVSDSQAVLYGALTRPKTRRIHEQQDVRMIALIEAAKSEEYTVLHSKLSSIDVS